MGVEKIFIPWSKSGGILSILAILIIVDRNK
jgi:hypothetical protein